MSADNFDSQEMKTALQQTLDFIKHHNLHIRKVIPTIAGNALDQYNTEKLHKHGLIHLNITLELDNGETPEKKANQSNLVASNIYENQEDKPLNKSDTGFDIAQLLEVYFKERLAENLQQAIEHSKVQFPEHDQFTKFYEEFKTNLINDLNNDAKLKKEFSSKIYQAVEQSKIEGLPISKFLAKSMMKSVAYGNVSFGEVSKLQQSYLQLKINEIFDENKSKLLNELKEEIKTMENSSVGGEKLMLSKFMIHYDALKSKILGDLEKHANQSIIESQLKQIAFEPSRQEVIIQEFINNLPATRIDEVKEEEEGGQSSHAHDSHEKSKVMNVSVFLHNELKNYVSRLIHANMQVSSTQ